MFLFLNILVLSCIKGHPTTKKYTLIISAVNVVNALIRTIVNHCGLFYSWD